MKKNHHILTLLFSITIIACTNSYADVRLSKLFGSNMILQRNQIIPIWGWAEPGEQISITIVGKSLTTTAKADSSWQIDFSDMRLVGHPFDILIQGKNFIKLENVLMGDVWLCGGQSNMEFTFEMLGAYKEITSTYRNDAIRLIDVDNISSQEIKKDIKSEGWKVTHPNNTSKFSAVGFFFAEELQKRYQIPIGLIASNWGGSPAEVWMSPTALASFPTIISEYRKKEEEIKTRIQFQHKRSKELPKWIEKVISLDSGSIQSWGAMLNNIPASWQNTSLPGMMDQNNLDEFDGIIWFAKTFDVPSSFKSKEDMLELGKIDDADATWLNGVKIGNTNTVDEDRNYKIPSGLLKPNNNILIVRLLDHGWNGGIQKDTIAIRSSLGAVINLNGEWKTKTGYNFKNLPEFIEPDYVALVNWQPSSLYNGMIAPLLKVPLKGVIWYQGESNAGRAYEYRKLFPALIQDWRMNMGNQNLPFLYVQLANYLKPDSTPQIDPWPELREAQLLALKIPNTGMAVAIDVGEEKDIHPKNKQAVGMRLAKIAEKLVYKENIIVLGPLYKSMKIEDSKIRINFTELGRGLMAKGGELMEFAIAGADQKFVYAKAKIDGNSIIVYSSKVPQPVAVRYAWANNPSKANLYNLDGYPASPFRTDTWKGITYGVSKIE